MPEQGRYLYAVTRDVDAARLSGITGLDGVPLEVVRCDELVGVVSTVDLARYGEDALRANLEHLDWLSQVARQHDAVVAALSTHGPVAPMRLATIFHDDHRVVERLRETYDALTAALDRVQGSHEWSVKVLVDEAAVVDGADSAPATSGAEYLRRKKEAADARVGAATRANALAVEVHEALSSVSRASRRLPAQDRQLSGHQGTMVLNGAYLVPDEGGARFEETLDALRRTHPGPVLDCQGPWPPYSFSVLEEP